MPTPDLETWMLAQACEILDRADQGVYVSDSFAC